MNNVKVVIGLGYIGLPTFINSTKWNSSSWSRYQSKVVIPLIKEDTYS